MFPTATAHLKSWKISSGTSKPVTFHLVSHNCAENSKKSSWTKYSESQDMDWQAKLIHIKQMSVHFLIINKSHDLRFSSAIWTYQFQI